jgi:hypothetical protein
MYDESKEGIKIITDFTKRDFPSGDILFFERGLFINSNKLYRDIRLNDKVENFIISQSSMKELDLSKYPKPVVEE